MSAALRVAVLLFGSGFCALVYQTAWLRMLRDVFGASTAASAAVLAIFMGGLGFGGLLLGPLADRRRSPLGFYALLEMGVAVAAGLSPWLVAVVQKAYIGLGGSASLGLPGGTVVRLLLAALVLGVPTFLMGGTLPAASRAVERSADEGRRVVGLLYALNTLGAVAGTLLTTFWALEALGVRKTVWIAALLNLLIALVARNQARALPAEEAAGEGGSAEPAAGGADGAATGWFVPLAAGVVGFAFLLMELVWYRMLAPLLGGSSYTFGLILALALLGIGLGGLLYAAGPAHRRPTLATFAGTCALEALFLALPFAAGDRVAVVAAMLRPLGNAGFFPLILGWSAVTAFVVLPAAVVAGYQFPLLIALLGSGRERVGREIGVTYAANTVGAIAGSIAGGFGLLPLLTAPGVWRLVVVLLLLLAVAAVIAGAAGAAGQRRGVPLRAGALPLATAAVVLLLLSAPGPTAFWRHSPIGAGRVDSHSWNGPNDVRAYQEMSREGIVWEADGVESSVALNVSDEISFLVNGKADGTARSDAPTQVMGGLVGALLHPSPRRALVVGLGTGSTAGWLAAVPTMERVDVVELEPAVVEVARACAAVNQDVLRNPKVHLVIGDGRELLLTTGERYDIIFSEPSNPYRAGIASLFTEDFYRAVRQRLRPGGVFLQWLQGYELDAQVVGLVYGTLGAVFPAVETWAIHVDDLLLVASTAPLSHDVARLRARAAQEPYRTALSRVWGVEGAEGFYTGYLASPGLARAMHAREGQAINTDDHPILEFGFARNLGRRGLFRMEDLSALAALRREDRPALQGTLDWSRVQELRSARWAFWARDVPQPAPGVDPAAAERILARRAWSRSDLPLACARWLSQPEGPAMPSDRLLVAECMATVRDPEAPAHAEGLRQEHPVEADLVLAIWHLAAGRSADAARHLAAAFRAARAQPWTHQEMLDRGLLLAERLALREPAVARVLYEALDEPFAVRLSENARLRVRFDIVRGLGWQDRCVEALAPFEPHPIWEEQILAWRAVCYEQKGHPLQDRALRDLQDFLDDAPPKLGAGLPASP